MLLHLPMGTVLAFEYQAPEGHWEPRLGVLWSVRDLEQDPLSTEAISERPDLERSRYLLEIWDFARRDYRHFYHERIRNWEPTDPEPVLLAAKRQRMAEKSCHDS